MLPLRNFKYLLLGAFITLGLLGASGLARGEERAKSNQSTLEEEKLSRDPFSLPAGVKFLKKEGAEAGASSRSTEVEASHVDGIFQSGKKVMASINGVWVEEGGWVGEEQVTEIKSDKVVLAGKRGEKRVLPFKEEIINLKVTERVKPKIGEKK